MTTLPYDVMRCAGRYDLLPDGGWCPERDTCKRYLAFTQWDRGLVPNYRGIPVSMAVPACEIKIEVEHD